MRQRVADAIQATGANLIAADRRARIAELAARWTFLANDKLREVWLPDLFSGIEAVTSGATVAISHHYELPYAERLVLDVLTRHLQPTCILEMGTYTGTTTRLLADAAPDATVHTIDRPPGRGADPIGSAFRDAPANIVQHRSDLREFDFTPFQGGVDLVFIDASHAESQVLADSRAAFRLLAPRGVIVWDDYHAAQPGVVRALNRLADERAIVHVTGTRLALYRS